jgi:flagellar L-ring protein precursor FlgH
MWYKIFFILIISVIFIGCSKHSIDMNATPQIQVPKKPIAIKRRKGTLYSQQGTSLFSDKKDLQIGDILQVIVQETLKNDSKGSRSIKKDTTSSLGGGVFAPATAGMNSAGVGAKLENMNNSIGFGFKATTANAFAGSASSKVDEKFSTTISVIIEETYQNGNYFVKGSKELLIDGQKQSMDISGVIRPYDITPENTVFSHQLANLKIKYLKDGEENDGNHKSWGTKLIETVWPF